MIRKASLAAMLLTSAMLSAQSASAAITLNGRISQIINSLHNNTHFSPRDFSFKIDTSGGTQKLFGGLEGIRGFTDFQMLSDLLTHPPQSNTVFDGGPYKFTHSVLGSYFDQLDDQPEPQGYRVLAAPELVPELATAPIPEPTTWAMMIGGFALAGLAMRRRKATVSFA